MITLVNTIGSGMWVASMAIFLTRVAGLGVVQLGIGLTTAAFVCLAASSPMGYAADRFGARSLQVAFYVALAVLSPHPAIFWPAMFITLLLLFLNTGPLNAAMANVLPFDLRARGFALYTVAIHLLGDAISPPLIGVAADHVGLKLPVLASGLLLAVAGVVLLVGRRSLVADLRVAAS